MGPPPAGGPRLPLGRRRSMAPPGDGDRRAAGGGWGNRQPAGLWSRAVSVRVRVPQRRPSSPSRRSVIAQETSAGGPSVAAVVVLAAGQGTRMRSATPKVLHTLGGRSL